MTKEQHSKANDLRNEIAELESTLKYFSSSTVFKQYACDTTSSSFMSTLETDVKTIGVKKLTDRIEILKAEYNSI